LKDLIKDLAEEYASLDAFVAPLGEEAWDRETPFESWTVRDEICHLAVIDNAARLSVTDEEGFIRHRRELFKLIFLKTPSKRAGPFPQETFWPGGAVSGSFSSTLWRPSIPKRVFPGMGRR
jgi:hypothetical protein